MADDGKSAAIQFLVMVGVVNLFADLTYEGGRSITGPFLAQLGASAAVVSIVSGFGEFAGYVLRAVSGRIADRTGRHWALTVAGYALNMFAVPAMALAGTWPAAACLIVAERTGRAIRRPVVQGMISHAGELTGRGWAFGLTEALDSTGATIGPLVVALVLARGGGYRAGFAVLLVSALLCLIAVTATRRTHPHPHRFEERRSTSDERRLPRGFWLYVAGGAMIGFGFVDFSLIAFHFIRTATMSSDWVPIGYAVAMAVGAGSNLLLGHCYDRFGSRTMILVFFLGALFTPLVFFGDATWAIVGMALWGINKGAQDTLFKPAISHLIAPGRRSTAFGTFDAAFGTMWFAGSITLGLLYNRSLTALVAVSVVAQIASLPLFFLASRTSEA